MLRVCTQNEFEKYIDFAYALATDPTKSGYPSYSDGIKTKEMFVARSRESFLRDTEEILLFELDGKIEGWIHYYFLPEDNYLSTVSFNIASHTEQALSEFLQFAKLKFEGHDLFLGFSTKNKPAVEFLSNCGFELIEEDNNNTGLLKQYKPISVNGGIVRITKDNFGNFRKIHCIAEDGMYWNSDRIYDSIDDWVIFVKMQEGDTVGSVYYNTVDDGWFEIFGIDLKDNVFDEIVVRELLGIAMNTAKDTGGTYMTFFCGDEEQKVADKLGFTLIDKYVCYKKSL
ncbi:MAG: hypothetical protein NC350_04250 [Corallococcus sp.]|nr:hypothetical protein [Corallococcus sp.]